MSGKSVRFLIVEDDQEKLRRILQVLSRIDGFCLDLVDIVRDVNGAQRALTGQAYDLVVLDLVLPIRPDQLPDQNAGVELLREIHDSDGEYRIPANIIGLTAFSALRDAAIPVFDQYLTSLMNYDESGEWEEKLRRRARSILLSSGLEEGAQPATDLCIVTALTDLELGAIRRLDWNWSVLDIADSSTNFFEGKIQTSSGLRRVVAASAGRMGMVPTAVLATKMVYLFRPSFLAMTGITAGVRDECNIGDAVCAEMCWDWGSGKHTIVDGKAVFLQAPYPYMLDARLKNKFERLADDREALALIRSEWQADKPMTELRLHIGPVASGAAVLADDAMMEKLRAQHRKVIGVDMEAYSVFAACEETVIPEPLAFVLKGVSDYGGGDKKDKDRQYAAFISARLLDVFARRYL